MRSLIAIITSVLNAEETIPELPVDQLMAFKGQGQPIPGTVDQVTFLKIARLQTLIVGEQEKAGIPEMDFLKQSAVASGQEIAATIAISLTVQEDTTSNIMMLERLIVEIVRDDCPGECERFGVRYVADISMQVCFCEAPRQRFLD